MGNNYHRRFQYKSTFAIKRKSKIQGIAADLNFKQLVNSKARIGLRTGKKTVHQRCITKTRHNIQYNIGSIKSLSL